MLFLGEKRLRAAKGLARLAADRAVLRFVHGLQLVMDGGIAEIGSSPKDLILKDGKLEVYRYKPPETEEVELGHETITIEPRSLPIPILLVPPLMVRPYVYDLRAEHSMVRALRRAGFDVWLVDFGEPGAEDAGVKLDDYVLSYLPKAIGAVRRATGRKEISIVGYCMGGIFGLLYTAAWNDSYVKNIVTIAAPIDFSKMGLLTVLARAANGQVRFLADRIGNIPGQLNSQALKMLAPVKRFTRYADLFVNLWNEEYVRGFESMSRWANDFIPYPRDAFKQFMKEFFAENGLVSGLTFGDKTADLRNIRCSLLAFAGTEDQIATTASARVIRDLCASSDFEYVEVPGGHIGVVAGARARSAVWDKTAAWLRPRSV
jgi:polyhydroxyalkanoate synthase